MTASERIRAARESHKTSGEARSTNPVETREVKFNIEGEEITAAVDPLPWPIKAFERSRPYVTTQDGTEYVLTISGSGYVAHPVKS